MKGKQVFLFFAILSTLFFTGCGVYPQQRIYYTSNGSVKVSGVSFFENYPEITHARAIEIAAKAKYYEAMVEKQKNSNGSIEFYCGVRNKDLRKTFNAIHPESGDETRVAPGDAELFITQIRHRYIMGYFDGDKKTRKYRLRDTSKIEKNVKVDYGVSVP